MTPASHPDHSTRHPAFRVDGWLWSLDVPPEALRTFDAVVSDDERARANRFVRPVHRDRHIAGRGRLRQILGDVTGTDPRDLVFLLNPQGKPALDGGPHFNLSHTGALAALAVSDDGPLGIDIERRAEIEDAVARHSFSPAEYAALSRLPATEWRAGFYRCWTRKEAIIKAVGLGLSMPLDSFDVSLTPDAPVELLRIDGDRAESWRLIHFDPAPGVTGALAARTDGRDIARTWRETAP